MLPREAHFSPDYREAEVRAIMAAVYRLRSVAVVGPAGMGKSNLVRFLAAHPQVHQAHLRDRVDQYAFVHIDCAGLLESAELDLLDAIAAQLQRGGLAPASVPFPDEPRAARRALQNQVLAVPPERNLALLLDNFDEVAQKMGRSSFNYLCSLRNARPLRNMVYLFVSRRPLGPLYELQELFDDPVVVGPLGGRDARAMLEREAVRLGCTLTSTAMDRLIACTGGHPGFLKNASELLAGGRLDTRLSDDEWAREMLQAEKIRLLGEELWADLTPAEQSLLLQFEAQPVSEGTPAAAWLLRCGILRENGGPPRIFCPLFVALVRSKAATPGTVRIIAVFPNRARIEMLPGEHEVRLTPRLFALLLALTRAPGQVIPVDELIAQVYGNEAAGVTDAALAQLVKRLRAALDPWIQKTAGLPNYTSVETVWGVGYRLNSEAGL
jgi:DNA-binding winged helix-turn-helix (wHTH) protein